MLEVPKNSKLLKYSLPFFVIFFLILVLPRLASFNGLILIYIALFISLIIFIVRSIINLFKKKRIETINTINQTSSNSNIPINSPAMITETPKKRFSVLRVIGALLLFFILVGVFMFFAIIHTEKEIKKQLFFGGDEKAQEEYNRIDRIYSKANQGDYEECLIIDDVGQRQFCLNLALNAVADLRICDLMDKEYYPPENSKSQESCYVSIAAFKNDRSVCERVVEKESCVKLFDRLDAQRSICGPLFKTHSAPSPSDCYDYAVAQKTKSACDGLIPAGGQNWKEICDIKAGLVSTSTLSIAPKNIDECVMTKVARVGKEVKGSAGAATAIEYLNGVKQLSVEQISQVDSAKVGDIVRLCLQALPDCSNWKYNGSVYGANNISGGFTWTLADSIELCKDK